MRKSKLRKKDLEHRTIGTEVTYKKQSKYCAYLFLKEKNLF